MAEVGLGYARGLSKKEIAAWLDKSEFAIDALGRRLYQRLGIHSQQGVAGLVGLALAELEDSPPTLVLTEQLRDKHGTRSRST